MFKKLLPLLVLFACATAQDPDEFLRLERVWNEAHVQDDAAALNALWASDLTVIVPKMQVISKDVALTIARSGHMKFQRYETSDIKVRQYGKSAVVTGRLNRARDMNGNITVDDWRFTKTYVRRDGRWQVVAFQASEAAP